MFRSGNLLENGNKTRRNLPCGELLLSLIRTRSFGKKSQGRRRRPASLYYEGRVKGTISPKLRVRIKDNNSSPHGKFSRVLLPFSSKFLDLNFASYVLDITYVAHTVSLGYISARDKYLKEYRVKNIKIYQYSKKQNSIVYLSRYKKSSLNFQSKLNRRKTTSCSTQLFHWLTSSTIRKFNAFAKTHHKFRMQIYKLMSGNLDKLFALMTLKAIVSDGILKMPRCPLKRAREAQ